MRKYEKPEAEIIIVAAEDIIRTSDVPPEPPIKKMVGANVMGGTVDFTQQDWN